MDRSVLQHGITIRENLRSMRLKNRLSQTEAAKMLSVTEAYYERLESGSMVISAAKLGVLAVYYGAAVEKFYQKDMGSGTQENK